jgi:putative transposase
VRKSFKYRLHPTKAQAAFLNQQLWEACDLYNCALQERRDAWKTCRVSVHYYDQANQLKAMRNEALVKLANFSCCQDVLRRVQKNFDAFFKRCREGRKPGYPRFKSARRYDSITFPTYGDGLKLINTRRLRVQGAGHIRIRLHRPVTGRIKTATIKREINKWFVCFSVECEARPLPPCSAEVGVDVGLDYYAVLSDGMVIENPRWLRKTQKKLRRKQRHLARCQRGSHRRRKAVRAVALAHRRVFRQRNDFQHKFSRWLVNHYGLICIENLNIQGLAGGMLAKSVHDAAWGGLFHKLSYKAADADRILSEPEAYGSSQECVCGASVQKTLKDRWHHCTSCGLSGPRDYVSAKVILRRGRRRLGLTCPVAECVPREAVCFSLRSYHHVKN